MYTCDLWLVVGVCFGPVAVEILLSLFQRSVAPRDKADTHCFFCLQAEHTLLLQQVQQLDELRKENAEMAQLVAQLAMLRRDQEQLHELCQQVEVLRSDNTLLLNKSQRLPALQEEHQRLQVGCRCFSIYDQRTAHTPKQELPSALHSTGHGPADSMYALHRSAVYSSAGSPCLSCDVRCLCTAYRP